MRAWMIGLGHDRTLELRESAERDRALVENHHAVTLEYDLFADELRYLSPLGTTFYIRLPIAGQVGNQAAAA